MDYLNIISTKEHQGALGVTARFLDGDLPADDGSQEVPTR